MRKEVFKGAEVKGAHRSGSELAAATILGYAAAAYGLYCWDANVLTGALLGARAGPLGSRVQPCAVLRCAAVCTVCSFLHVHGGGGAERRATLHASLLALARLCAQGWAARGLA